MGAAVTVMSTGDDADDRITMRGEQLKVETFAVTKRGSEAFTNVVFG